MHAGYGYDGKLESIRGQYSFQGVYLDNAAAPLVAKNVAMGAAEYIVANPLVNPHSRSYWAQKTIEMVRSTREKFLELLNTTLNEYDLVFTQNATHALKLVGECMAEYNLVYLIDSHTSVVGLRALSKSYSAVNFIDDHAVGEKSIVSWPLQSNFDGKRYPGKEWAELVARNGDISLVDLSSFCATSMPDFSSFKPDLAVLSFYKIFGLPDLGALIVRKSPKTAHLLEQRRYAGGGTVALITPIQSYMVRQTDVSDSLEDGTIPVHSIATLLVAMRVFKQMYGDFEAIAAHASAITDYCRSRLEELSFCQVWSDANQGPIIALTLATSGYQEFANVCSKLDIHVRTGTLCNVGAFTLKSSIKDDDLVLNYKLRGKTCSDEMDIIDGVDTGVIRVSFGPYSACEDVDKLIDAIVQYFGPANPAASGDAGPLDAATIQSLVIYPIKSCAALEVDYSLVTSKGLQYDREFCLINPLSGKVYSLKKFHVMNLIHSQPIGDNLRIEFANSSIEVPLDVSLWCADAETAVEFCTDRAAGMHINSNPEVVEFLSSILKAPCTLAKIADPLARNSRNAATTVDTPLSLSNSSPILLVSATSALDLNAELGVFRANVIVETAKPWAEDTWAQLAVGTNTLDVLGPCRRCNMVCVRPNGESNPDAYLKLTKSRRFNGKLWFGQHVQSNGSFELKTGDLVECTRPKPPIYDEQL